jgi:hypothetical protein
MDSQLWKLERLWEILSPLTSSLYFNDFTVLSRVFGDLIRIFGYEALMAGGPERRCARAVAAADNTIKQLRLADAENKTRTRPESSQ